MTYTVEQLEKMLTDATKGPWSGHNMTHAEGRPMTPKEIGEYVENSVKMGAQDRFLFVSGKHDDGMDCDICHTGNGPRGPANTALILSAPTLATAHIAALKRVAELEALVAKAALYAECAFDDRPNRQGINGAIDWQDGYRDGTRAAAAAIRTSMGDAT